jgi:hypothetical protein
MQSEPAAIETRFLCPTRASCDASHPASRGSRAARPSSSLGSLCPGTGPVRAMLRGVSGGIGRDSLSGLPSGRGEAPGSARQSFQSKITIGSKSAKLPRARTPHALQTELRREGWPGPRSAVVGAQGNARASACLDKRCINRCLFQPSLHCQSRKGDWHLHLEVMDMADLQELLTVSASRHKNHLCPRQVLGV